MHNVLKQVALVQSFNPFAVEHQSDSVSVAGVTPAPTTIDAFKRRVAKFYGLESADENRLVDMLGDERPSSDVTLAHVYPKSYANFGLYAAEMSLPPDFNTNPRNFMLLPRPLHTDFDCGFVAVIPSATALRIRVLDSSRASEESRTLDGRVLILPREAEGRVPYRRTLGWFAWLAMGATSFLGAARDVDVAVDGELEDAINASHNENALRQGHRGGTAHDLDGRGLRQGGAGPRATPLGGLTSMWTCPGLQPCTNCGDAPMRCRRASRRSEFLPPTGGAARGAPRELRRRARSARVPAARRGFRIRPAWSEASPSPDHRPAPQVCLHCVVTEHV